MTADPAWDLFRTFHAVAWRGGFAAAARALGLSQSTVSRHVALLEQHAGAPLLERSSPPRPTERGTRVLAAVEPMLGAALAATEALAENLDVTGEVTLATMGEVVRWVLARRLVDLYRQYPGLRLRILADSRIHSLASGEADLALRGARPARGALVARRLTVETFGFFAAATLDLGPATPWLGAGGALANVPEQKQARRAFAGRPPRLLVEDLDALGTAIASGLGVGVLPRLFAQRLPGVVEVRPARVGAADLSLPPRSFWLVVHRSKRAVPRVRAVATWIESLFEKKAAR